MNWEFRAISPKPQSLYELIADYSSILAEGLDEFIRGYMPHIDVQPEAYMAEFPEGFYRNEAAEPIAYRFRWTVGIYNRTGFVNLGAVPYDITIRRSYPDLYLSDLPQKRQDAIEEKMSKRIRYIDNVSPIE